MSPESFCNPTPTPPHTNCCGVDGESNSGQAGRGLSCRIEPREKQFKHTESRADYLIRSGHNSPIPGGAG